MKNTPKIVAGLALCSIIVFNVWGQSLNTTGGGGGTNPTTPTAGAGSVTNATGINGLTASVSSGVATVGTTTNGATAGQVLTYNSDNTVSFAAASGGGTNAVTEARYLSKVASDTTSSNLVYNLPGTNTVFAVGGTMMITNGNGYFSFDFPDSNGPRMKANNDINISNGSSIILTGGGAGHTKVIHNSNTIIDAQSGGVVFRIPTLGTSGTAIQHLSSATAVLDFDSVLAAGTQQTNIINVAVANANDSVILGPPADFKAAASDSTWFGFIAAGNKVGIVRTGLGVTAVYTNKTWRATVISH